MLDNKSEGTISVSGTTQPQRNSFSFRGRSNIPSGIQRAGATPRTVAVSVGVDQVPLYPFQQSLTTVGGVHSLLEDCH